MNQKLNNTCIKCESFEHGTEIVKFYNDNGFISNLYGGNIGWYYGVFNGIFTNYFAINSDTKLLTLQEAKDLVQENQYPKVMWVSDYEDFSWQSKRVVFMEKNGKFLSWANVETIEDAENVLDVVRWDYAKDIESEEENPLKARIEKLEIELNEIKKLI